MKHIVFLTALACGCCWAPAALAAGPTDSGPTVSVGAGELRGSLTPAGGAVFEGIPFAQPPVGNLRWHEPVAPRPWSGVRDATAFGPACVQGGGLGVNSSEDCLYLNVWTPKWPMKSPVAVMVWIYGGGNFAGAASDPTFSGESLASHGIVLVTINYRLGVFGFLAHPELTAASPRHVSGNYGLLDQIAGLRWVHDNIAAFGGDPGNVTIFGESAGSLDVNVLMASPLSKGLFERVIGESGPVIDPPPLAEAEKKGEEFAALLNATGPNSIERLRTVSSADLLKATPPGLSFMGPNLGLNVDGWLFPESPMKAFIEGRELPVDLMLGSNSQELQRPFFPMPGGDIRDAIRLQYGSKASQALALYGLDGATDPQPDPELGTAMAQWSTDSQFRCGSVAELVWHTRAGNSAYQFQFSRVVPGKEAQGAGHGSEVAFVFGTVSGSPGSQPNETDKRVSAVMEGYWTNFAKTGDPNGEGLQHWPRFDAATRAYIDLTNEGPIAKEGLRRRVCELYSQKLEGQFGK